MTIEKAIKEVEDRITKALLELGDSVFARSQALVPVQTGELKRSGSSGIYGNHFRVEYTAPYAADVEFGRNQPRDDDAPYAEEEERSEKTLIPSKRHRRTITRGKNRGKKVWVMKHWKTFKNYNVPIQVGENEYRTINSLAKTEGRHFLGNALEEILDETLGVAKGLEGKIIASKIIVKD